MPDPVAELIVSFARRIESRLCVVVCLLALSVAGCLKPNDVPVSVSSTGAAGPAPHLYSITPSLGTLTGSDTFEVKGENLSSGLTITIGGTACYGLLYRDATTVTCNFPPLPSGVYDLRAVNPDGQAAALPGSVTYFVVPVALSRSPTNGIAAGGNILTVTGTGFLPGATVKIGTTNCGSVNVIGVTTLTCVLPAKTPGTYDITVTNPDTQSSTLTNAYTYNPPPVIAGRTPTNGKLAGGNTLTITGSYFTNGLAVTVGGLACASPVLTGSTKITCTLPANVAGTYDIVVTNPDTQPSTFANAYTYNPMPALASVAPANGRITGTNTLTLTGTGFMSGATVTVGGAACTTLVVVSGTTITCKAPAQPAGTYDVVVTNLDTQAATLSSGYTYNPVPTITARSPINGPLAGGGTLTIDGTGFMAGATVTVGGTTCASPAVTPTQITCTLAAHASGSQTIVITNPDTQSVSLVNGYNYNPFPALPTLNPTSGKLAGGTNLTITGSGFISGAAVTVGGVPCASVNVVSSTSITCVTPSMSAGSYDLTITNPDAQFVTLGNGFTYNPFPSVSSISPTNGRLSGTNTLTITGTGFLAGAAVTVGGSACTSVSVPNSTTITCAAPAKTAGTYSVAVTNADTQSAALPASYTYNPLPTITSRAPTNGKLAGGGTLTINGTGFMNGVTVTIGGTACASPALTGSTTITCTVPAKTAGSYAILVTNLDTQSISLPSGYTYNPIPTITSQNPTNGKYAGGDTLTLTGTGFLAGGTIKIGANDCTSPNIVSATSATCTVPANVDGNYNIVFTNLDTQSATLVNGYTYNPFPISAVSPNNGKLAGGDTLTLTGTDFVAPATVAIGGTACTSPNVVNSTTIMCDAPAKIAGTYSVVITNGDSTVATRLNGYAYNPFPAITSRAPTNGKLAGGNTITLTGTGYLAGATATIGGLTCASPAVVSATSFTCAVPANVAGSYDIVLTNADTQSVTFTGGYTYNPFPTLASVNPTNGKLAAGTSLTLTGTGFISGATVTVGGTACTSPSVTNSTTMTCAAPAKAAGTYSIIVTNPDTQASNTLTGAYTYNPLPTISSRSPTNGKLAGGDTLTISGTGFMSGVTVTIGGTSCTSLNLTGSTQITCTVPAKSAGSYTVLVRNPDTQTASTTYVYNPIPTISSITPKNGPMAGGGTLTINGTGFLGGLSVTIGGLACAPPITSATIITCTIPANSAGIYDVVVTNTDTQSVTLTSGYKYNAFPLAGVSPTNGKLAGGDTLTISGSGFVSGAAATIGGTNCTSPNVVNSTTMTCVSPAKSAGSYDVIVTNPDTSSSTLTNGYTYNPQPTVASVSPASGKLAGGTTLTVTGTNFMSGATVAISGTPCTSPNVASATSITCTLPAKIAGSYSATVTNLDTQSAAGGTYTYNPFPTVSSLAPASGSKNGGTALSISGTGFLAGATVTVGGASCGSLSVPNSFTINCTTPAGTLGAAAVVVTNADTQSVNFPSFTYAEPTNAAQSTLKVSASMVPHDGIAAIRVFVVPRTAAGAVQGTGKAVEISVSSANVTLSGGTACQTPSATCMKGAEVAPGVYSVSAVSSTAGTYTFSSIVRENPNITVTQTAAVSFNTANFTVISTNTTVTGSSAGQNLSFTGGISTFDATAEGEGFGHIFARNATIKHSATTNSEIRRLNITASSLTLMSGGIIDASSLGFLSGPDGHGGDSYGDAIPSQALASFIGAGASHGGKGGYWSGGSSSDVGAAYGDFKDPLFPGSGAFGMGIALAGGGVARITAAEYCTINSGGAIRANASNASGGAGGSIYLKCSGFAGDAGTDAVTANGSNAVNGSVSGGGGGRIAIISTGVDTSLTGSFAYTQSSAAFTALKQSVRAYGGIGVNSAYAAGGAGTVFLKHGGVTYGDLIIDNGKGTTISNDGPTELLSATDNSSRIFANSGSTIGQVTASGSPYADMLNLFTGYLLHVFPVASSANPLDGSHIAISLTGNDDNRVFSAGGFPAISDNYSYRFTYRLDRLDIDGLANVTMNGADLILQSCDMHSGSPTTFAVPAGSKITGNSFASPTCLDASVGTKGTTVNFSNYYLQ
ncbi:MAG: IPT/TIG domain-containing protein [Deltaproteobacteria bacterium]|nr:IPT/TIG domain-containing protein [Deltaproteobacteria bacterium]